MSEELKLKGCPNCGANTPHAGESKGWSHCETVRQLREKLKNRDLLLEKIFKNSRALREDNWRLFHAFNLEEEAVWLAAKQSAKTGERK